MKYAVKIQKDGAGYMASFPDIPEALTGGDTVEETLALAADALKTAIVGYMELRKGVPVPTPGRRGYQAIALPEVMQAKVLLWNEMVRGKVSKSELARRLGKTESYVRRMLDPYENVTINSLSEAAHALKKRISMELVTA
ncbi:MAG: type II toxin-antitoxin system HicB family antitoxin [Proteobacteria bacterium]|nr:type II toxin-antitoxin system HicB family antitoxin [Pseudomonadota bacterium]